MLQGLTYEFDQVMPIAVAMGTFVSLCTLQSPSSSVNPDGTPVNTYADVSGLVGIECMDAVLSDASIQATESKTLMEILSKTYRHVLLSAFYAAVLPGVGNGWRAVITDPDGTVTAYDLLGAEPDSQQQMIRLKLQLATV